VESVDHPWFASYTELAIDVASQERDRLLLSAAS